MHCQGVNINLLVALDALLKEKSVTRAAERVHISQPGMSAALKKLREHYSDPLLQRSGRGLELTARGRELAGPVNELLLQIRAVLDPRLFAASLLVRHFNAHPQSPRRTTRARGDEPAEQSVAVGIY